MTQLKPAPGTVLNNPVPLIGDFPLASVSVWCFGQEPYNRTVIEVFLDTPEKIHEVYRIAIDKHYPVWEPIQEIIDWECLHGR